MRKPAVMAVDLVLVIIFAAIGRASHHEAVFTGLARTAWPFVLACLVAWAVLLIRRRPVTTPGAGVFVWLVTAWGGLALRVASGTSAAFPFMVVATIVTGLFLVGWRVLLRRRLTA